MKRPLTRASRRLAGARQMLAPLADVRLPGAVHDEVDRALGALQQAEAAIARELGAGPTARERREGLSSGGDDAAR